MPTLSADLIRHDNICKFQVRTVATASQQTNGRPPQQFGKYHATLSSFVFRFAANKNPAFWRCSFKGNNHTARQIRTLVAQWGTVIAVWSFAGP